MCILTAYTVSLIERCHAPTRPLSTLGVNIEALVLANTHVVQFEFYNCRHKYNAISRITVSQYYYYYTYNLSILL